MLVASIMLAVGIGSCYVGQRQWERHVQESTRQMAASGFYISDDPGPDTNNWQILGALVLIGSLSLSITAFMLWKQDRKV